MRSQVPLKAIADLRKQSEDVAGLLKVMSHPQRLMVLCSLVDGEKSVSEIEAFCGASQSAVSQFLKAMRLEGLVDSRRVGQHVYYRVADPRILELMRSLHMIFCR